GRRADRETGAILRRAHALEARHHTSRPGRSVLSASQQSPAPDHRPDHRSRRRPAGSIPAMMNVIAALAGIVLVILVLWDVFVSMVLTRRATRQLQLTRGLVYAFRRVYAALARALHDMSRRENVLSVVGPLFLFFRFGAWALVLIFAFALLQWAAG